MRLLLASSLPNQAPYLFFAPAVLIAAALGGFGPGIAATVFKAKDAAQLWVRLDRRLHPGETRHLLLWYDGDLIDRYGDFFFVKSSIAWYPLSLEGRSYATFDITYHTPSHYRIASVGDRTDSTVAGPGGNRSAMRCLMADMRWRVSRWVAGAESCPPDGCGTV